MTLATMRWDTKIELHCGCTTRIEQVGYATPLPGPGEEWTCKSHGETEVRQAWRHGR